MAFDEGTSISVDGDELLASRMIEQEMESMRQVCRVVTLISYYR